MTDDGRESQGEPKGTAMSESGSRGDFGSPPWGPVDPVGAGPDTTQELPGLGTQRRATAQHRGRPAGGSWGGSGADETVVDAFTPIRRAPGDRDQGNHDQRDRGNGHRGRHAAGPYDSWPRDSRGPQPQPGQAPGTGSEATGDGGPDGDEATPGAPEARPAARSTKKKQKRRRSVWRELPVLVVVAVVLALIIKTYVVQAFYIPSGSMQNTLAIGDRVLINKVVYDIRGIDRGDIVVFNGDGSWNFGGSTTPSNPFARFWDDIEGIFGKSTGDIYIKRVIGLPGDHVACCDRAGRVTVNGVPLSEQSYLYPGNAPSLLRFSLVVPPGRLWVMGDHRAVSYDSRGHEGDPGGGTIPESSVLGRAFVIIWPPSRWGFLNIPGTFGQPRLSASAATALDNSALGNTAPVRVQSAWSPLPLALGLGGAVPLTWLQRRARSRWRGRARGRRSRPRGGGTARGRGRSV